MIKLSSCITIIASFSGSEQDVGKLIYGHAGSANTDWGRNITKGVWTTANLGVCHFPWASTEIR